MNLGKRGVLTREDVLRGEVQVADARQALTSARSTVSIASNIGPVTSLPLPGLSRVNDKTSPARSMIIPLGARKLDDPIASEFDMVDTLYRQRRRVNRGHKERMRDAVGKPSTFRPIISISMVHTYPGYVTCTSTVTFDDELPLASFE